MRNLDYDKHHPAGRGSGDNRNRTLAQVHHRGSILGGMYFAPGLVLPVGP